MHKKIINFHLPNHLLTSLIVIAIFITTLFSTKAYAATYCALSFSTTADATSVGSGSTITRTFTVKNIGGKACREVSYSLFYSPNEQFVSSTPAPRASNYYWYVGSLNRGSQATMTLTTAHVPTVDGTEIRTEGCAAARGAQDACVSSVIPVVSETDTATSTPVTIPVTTQPISEPVITNPTTTPTTSPAPTPISTEKEQGMWIWNFPSQMNNATGDQQLQTLSTYGFNVVYITIDDYIDIATQPEGAAKEQVKAAYFANLARFITKANSLGIAVDAEGGWKDWAKSANRWKGFALIDAVKAYNAAYPNAKLRGFQYDVEPYLLPEYETNKAQVLTEYVAFIDQSVERLVGSDLKFTMAIPHFYDDAQAWTPAISYGGKTVHTFNHLLTILEKKPGSEILIMSYRDFFEGANGTKEISQVEIQEAVGYSTKIIVSQETGNVDPAFVTYYGSTKAVLFDALAQIQAGFGSYTSYGGTAVHYMDSFLLMK